MIIDCISDLHGHYPKLEGGDLLIIAGDLTARDTEKEYLEFIDWIVKQQYRRKVVIPGNHDTFLEKDHKEEGYFFHTNRHDEYFDFDYLIDSGEEFEGLKIFGSPWTKRFKGMNPNCMAFTCETEEELFDKWKFIPHDVDILITHSPPWTILDKTKEETQVGSTGLMGLLTYAFRPKLWVFGHIHESYGQETFRDSTICVNASQVNERYEPVNKPVRIDL